MQGSMVGSRPVSQVADADAGPFDEKGPKLGGDMRPHGVEWVLEGGTGAKAWRYREAAI